ncbi:MAG: hypothetical protein WCX90_07875 [Thiohalomonadaceae bacterium]
MLDYVFFDNEIRQRFVDFLQTEHVPTTLSEADGLLVSIPEDLRDELCDRIDEIYDWLLQDDAALQESSEGGIEKYAAGVRVQLRDGSPCTIRLAPELMARLLTCISLEELRDTVQAIVQQAEDPDDLPICHTYG